MMGSVMARNLSVTVVAFFRLLTRSRMKRRSRNRAKLRGQTPTRRTIPRRRPRIKSPSPPRRRVASGSARRNSTTTATKTTKSRARAAKRKSFLPEKRNPLKGNPVNLSLWFFRARSLEKGLVINMPMQVPSFFLVSSWTWPSFSASPCY